MKSVGTSQGRPNLGEGPLNTPQGGGTGKGLFILIGRKESWLCQAGSKRWTVRREKTPDSLIFSILSPDHKPTVPTRLLAQFRPLLKLRKVVPLTD